MSTNFSKEYLIENKERVIKAVIIIMIAIAAVFAFFIEPKKGDDGIGFESSAAPSVSESDASTDKGIVICDVSGAVNAPQVVELNEGARIGDAIEAAGGLTDNADISSINRAAVVNDGDKILIPEKGTVTDPAAGADTQQPVASGSTAAESSGKININSADSAQLQNITGIGPVTAQKIIDYRTQNGMFRSVEDIKNVSGIGDKTFEKMKDQISV